jgi:hypothetical protein
MGVGVGAGMGTSVDGRGGGRRNGNSQSGQSGSEHKLDPICTTYTPRPTFGHGVEGGEKVWQVNECVNGCAQ